MPGAHPDAIQFYSYNGVNSSDITVTDNLITRGTGNAVQGVFFENARDILVSGNAMLGTMTNGISVAIIVISVRGRGACAAMEPLLIMRPPMGF